MIYYVLFYAGLKKFHSVILASQALGAQILFVVPVL